MQEQMQRYSLWNYKVYLESVILKLVNRSLQLYKGNGLEIM